MVRAGQGKKTRLEIAATGKMQRSASLAPRLAGLRGWVQVAHSGFKELGDSVQGLERLG